MLNIVVIHDSMTRLLTFINYFDEWASENDTNYSAYNFNSIDEYINAGNTEADIIFIDSRKSCRRINKSIMTLQENGCVGIIVFTTLFYILVFGDSQVHTFAFDQEPIIRSRIYEFLQFARDRQRMNYLLIKKKNQLIYIKYDDILSISSMGHILTIQTKAESISIRKSLSSIASDLPSNFVKCNKSYIINTNHVTSLVGKKITLIDGSCVFASRYTYPYMKELLSKPSSNNLSI